MTDLRERVLDFRQIDRRAVVRFELRVLVRENVFRRRLLLEAPPRASRVDVVRRIQAARLNPEPKNHDVRRLCKRKRGGEVCLRRREEVASRSARRERCGAVERCNRGVRRRNASQWVGSRVTRVRRAVRLEWIRLRHHLARRGMRANHGDGAPLGERQQAAVVPQQH